MKIKLFLTAALIFSVMFVTQIAAQEEDTGNASNFSAGADFYSNYIWRGSKLSPGPSIQPYLEFAAGGLTLGAWGSFDASGYTETDLYISYNFGFGLSLGVTDYYSPDYDVSDFSDSTGSHAFEVSAGYEIQGLSLSANCIVNEAGNIGSAGGDLYFEAGYAFENFNIFLGAGDGWHTDEGDFAICNVGLGTEREIKITDTFSIPVTGQLILNPDKKSLFVVVGFSL